MPAPAVRFSPRSWRLCSPAERCWPITARPQAAAAPAPFTAAERQHWSLQPVKNPKVPAVANRDRVRTPVDAFVLKRFESQQLTFSPPAGRAELIRRVKFDLLGLPPTPDEIDRFERDRSEHAYERLVDRFLADPHYGESWGRLWLDLVRFAETAGYNHDPVRPLAWKYRDYVVRSFNQDVPYNRFICQQIAGDELFPDSVDAQIATGYSADVARRKQRFGRGARPAGRAQRPDGQRRLGLSRTFDPLRSVP